MDLLEYDVLYAVMADGQKISGSSSGALFTSRVGMAVSAILTGLLIIAGILYGSLEQNRYEKEAQHHVSDFAEYTARKMRHACLSVPNRERAICSENAKMELALEVHKYRQASADLVAQRKSALWSNIMGVAALIGMALSALGVVLVWTTFREQRRSTNLAHAEAERAKAEADENGRVALEALATAQRNADATAKHVRVAQHTAQAQLRAYLSVKSAKIDREVFDEDRDAIVLEIVNNGQTPGTIRRVQIAADWFPSSGGKFCLLSYDGKMLFDSHHGTPVSAPIKLDDIDLPDGSGVMSVVGCLDYNDVFGAKHTVTFAFSSSENESYWDIAHGARFSATNTLNAEHQRRGRKKISNTI